MTFTEKIQNDFKEALKGRKETELSVLRYLMAILKNESIAKKKDLSEDEILNVISKEVKKRQESLDIYLKAGREELAQKEKNEIVFLEKYLPEKMDLSSLEALVVETINELGAKDKSQMGQVIKSVMSKAKGQADGKKVSEIVIKIIG